MFAGQRASSGAMTEDGAPKAQSGGGQAFEIALFARWPDIDFNQHMRNAAYLGAGEDCRMQFLTSRGFGIQEFARRGLGPVVLEDRIRYRRELRPLEPFVVELLLAGATHDCRRIRVRNRIVRKSDRELSATVDSLVMWLDTGTRKTIVPPEELRSCWLALIRTDDFAWEKQE